MKVMTMRIIKNLRVNKKVNKANQQGKSTKQKSWFAGAQSSNDDTNQDEMDEFSSYTVERSEMG